MIKYIEERGEPVEVSIIPKLKPYMELTLSPGDTLVAFVDHEKWDIEDAQQFYKLLEKTFPDNSICVLFDGIELGVVKK